MAIRALTTLFDVGGSAIGGAGSWQVSAGGGTCPTTICPTTMVGASDPQAEETPRQAERSSSVLANTLCSGVGSTDSMCIVLRSPVPHKLCAPPFRGVEKGASASPRSASAQ